MSFEGVGNPGYEATPGLHPGNPFSYGEYTEDAGESDSESASDSDYESS